MMFRRHSLVSLGNLIVFFVFLSATSARADLPWGLLPDYSASVGARSVPLAGSITGEAGATKLLWGDHNPGEFRFGYLRGSAKLRTSVLTNRPEIALKFYPISLFGLTAGYGLSQRGTAGFDSVCTSGSAACLGTLGGFFGGLNLKAGYAGFFFSGEASWSRLTPSDLTLPFYDETSSLVGTQGGDTRFSTSFVAGRVLAPKWAGGLLIATDAMLGNNTASDFEGAFGNYHLGAWSYTAGLGTYQSATVGRSIAAFGQVKWTGLPSIEL